MIAALMGLPLALRLLFLASTVAAGVAGVGWWSSSREVASVTRERDTALERVGTLAASNGVLQASIKVQNEWVTRYYTASRVQLAAGTAALEAARKAGRLTEANIAALLAKPLGNGPAEACTVADALILETIR